MLHSIATGNLLPASVEVVAVDINPAVVTKLADRGDVSGAGVGDGCRIICARAGAGTEDLGVVFVSRRGSRIGEGLHVKIDVEKNG